MSMSFDLDRAQRLADVIGFTATLQLTAWMGGRRCYIPVTSGDPEHLLRKIVGEQAFSKLAENFGGQVLEIPVLDLSMLRQAGIVHRLTAKEVSAEDIAEIAGICPRTVRLIRRQLRLEGWQDLASLLPAGEVDDCEVTA